MELYLYIMDRNYSQKPLTEKLDIKDGVLVYFISSKSELEKVFPKLKSILKKDSSLWLGWPKKASKIKSDLNENLIMEIGLNNGLVDVKVISVNEDWSALKFVYRIRDR